MHSIINWINQNLGLIYIITTYLCMMPIALYTEDGVKKIGHLGVIICWLASPIFLPIYIGCLLFNLSENTESE